MLASPVVVPPIVFWLETLRSIPLLLFSKIRLPSTLLRAEVLISTPFAAFPAMKLPAIPPIVLGPVASKIQTPLSVLPAMVFPIAELLPPLVIRMPSPLFARIRFPAATEAPPIVLLELELTSTPLLSLPRRPLPVASTPM